MEFPSGKSTPRYDRDRDRSPRLLQTASSSRPRVPDETVGVELLRERPDLFLVDSARPVRKPLLELNVFEEESHFLTVWIQVCDVSTSATLNLLPRLLWMPTSVSRSLEVPRLFCIE